MIKKIMMIFAALFITACSLSPPATGPLTEPKSTYLKQVHPQVILVLGSGSARGFAHAGVLKALEKNHIPIDMIVGTSAGSIVGALYAGNPSASALEQLLLTTPRSQVIQFSLINVFSGPFRGDVLQRYLVSHIRATDFDQLQIPLIAVATNLQTGEIHTFSSGKIAPAINASSAAPPFFQPVQLYGETYIDGGMVDPVAVDVAKRFHPKIIIAVDLAPHLSEKGIPHGPQVFVRGVGMALSKLSEYSAAGADIIIHPNLNDISMFDGDNRKQSIKIGFDTTMHQMPKIKELLTQNHIALRSE